MISQGLVLGVIGLFLASGAIYYDAWWHFVIGRESFWIPPHLVLYFGVCLTGLGFLVQALERWRTRSSWGTPLKAWGFGVFLIFLAAPFDELWHRIFGKETIDSLLIVWSPPHLLGWGAAITIGIALLLALVRNWEREPSGLLLVLILLTFAAINGFFYLLLSPFSPLNHRVWGALGAFVFYVVFISWQIAALDILRRPVLTYLATFQRLFSGLLISANVMEGSLEFFHLLLLMMAGILAGMTGDVAFLALRKRGGRLLYPLVGLIYMAVAGLLFNQLLFTDFGSFDLSMIPLVPMAGGLAGGFIGSKLGQWLKARAADRAGRADEQQALEQVGRVGVLQMNAVMAGLFLAFIVIFIKLSDPMLLESDGPRLAGQEELIGQIPSWLQLELKTSPSVWVSPDGQRLAYKAKKGKKWVVVVDDVEGQEYDEILGLLKFSPDGKRFMYAGRRGDKFVMVVDGMESKEYDGIFNYFFTPDSHRHVIVAMRAIASGRPKFIIVTDGSEGPEYDEIRQSSLEGQRIAYSARRGKKWVLVKDSIESQEFEEFGWRMAFSPDSQRFAYSAKHEGKWKVIVDGAEKGDYEAVRPFGSAEQPAFFSADGQRVAYAAKRGGMWFAVIDGVEGPPYDFIEGDSSQFSPDSQRVIYTAMKGEKWRVVLDGVEGKGYDRVAPVQFSPDGRKIAYIAMQEGRLFLVTNGIEGPKYQAPARSYWSDIRFSPDSQRVAYLIPGFRKLKVVMDGKESREYHRINDHHLGPDTFSPDGRHVAFMAALGRRWRVVVDGIEGKVYDAIAGLRFYSSDVVSYIAVDGRSILRVEHQLDIADASP